MVPLLVSPIILCSNKLAVFHHFNMRPHPHQVAFQSSAHATPRGPAMQLYNKIVWWSFFACSILFLRAFFGLGTFNSDEVLSQRSLESSSQITLGGDFSATINNLEALSTLERGLHSTMATHDLVDDMAAKFVSETSGNLTAGILENGDTHLDDDELGDPFSLDLGPMSSFDYLSHDNDVNHNHENEGSESRAPSRPTEYASPFTTRFASGNYDYTVITSFKSRTNDGDDYSQPEPFITFEELDGDDINFALKIWVDGDDVLLGAGPTARLGEGEICEGSRGIKCWSDD